MAQAIDPRILHRARQRMDPTPAPTAANKNFVKSGATAPEIMGGRLGNFFTREQEEFAAVQHEMRTGEIVPRTWETAEETQIRASKLQLVPDRPDLMMSPPLARAQLARLERQYRTRPVNVKNKTELAKATDEFAYMNKLRKILGMPEHDYLKEPAPDVNEALHVAYAEFSKIPEAEQRLAKVASIDDPLLLKLIATMDVDQAVKRAAEIRYGQIVVGGAK
jgi:hypothetical protein